MPQQDLLELAKRGHAGAIAILMNRHLYPKGISADVELQGGCLSVVLEAQQIPGQQESVEFIRRGMMALRGEWVRVIKICGREMGAETAAWTEEIELPAPNEIEALSFPLPLPESAPVAANELGQLAPEIGQIRQSDAATLVIPQTVKTLAGVLTIVALGVSWLVYQYLVDPNAQPMHIQTEKVSAALQRLNGEEPSHEDIAVSRITKAKYDRVATGMSYAQVLVILGNAGEESSRNQLLGSTTVMYVWRNSNGSSMNALFENDKLIQKAQFGLK